MRPAYTLLNQDYPAQLEVALCPVNMHRDREEAAMETRELNGTVRGTVKSIADALGYVRSLIDCETSHRADTPHRTVEALCPDLTVLGSHSTASLERLAQSPAWPLSGRPMSH
jgi:hypothetical protein